MPSRRRYTARTCHTIRIRRATHRAIRRATHYRGGTATHVLDTSFRGLRAVHRDPWIFVIDGFLSDHECDSLVAKSVQNRAHGTRSVSGGQTTRTNHEVLVHADEVPRIRQRMKQLLCLHDDRRFEALKLSHYRKGQAFSSHVDASRRTDGTNRVVTMVIYLNTVPDGGATCFNDLPSTRPLRFTAGEHVSARWGSNFFPGVITRVHPTTHTCDVAFDDGTHSARPLQRQDVRTCELLRVRPRKGNALLFFPAYMPSHPLAGHAAPHLTHESEPTTTHDKFICQQWVWSAPYTGGNRLHEVKGDASLVRTSDGRVRPKRLTGAVL